MKTVKNCIDSYEIPSPNVPDMSLPDQIEMGINDWVAENLITGQIGYGKTEAEAIANIPKDFV
jgi:hypothetical protein